MYTVTGLLTGFRQGVHNDMPQVTALVLPEGATQPAQVILHDASEERVLASHVRKVITLSFVMLSGRSDKGRWTMLVDGRLVPARQAQAA